MSRQTIKILRLRDVVQKIGVARSTIYDWINPKSPRYDPTFPRQIPLGKKSVGWLESALNEWLMLRHTPV
ncbi:helix-turn-helix transcriptional regulator [Budvicia aquatica]|uniref:AlpA family phage regulatory protein n=1 Tax=Budvicia aquatica TaxID=82979 RepID=A0A2C6C4K1_9GAMM|nr:AlpA family phage regulatory protein [Budvicia aquatica]PHI31280.1 AlpA family phage regulatory protein [Budvicia aquatica]VFS51572.1 Predicted transcriptional regulator [Budvicia aquatica]